MTDSNQKLQNIVSAYAFGKAEFESALRELNSDDVKQALQDILTIYFNDTNSSTLREWITLILAGYEPTWKKLGYNGFRITESGAKEHCEVKPVNVIRTTDQMGQKKKLNGGGNFTDFTWDRLNKSKKENPMMLVSGFVDGKIIYILKFPFNTAKFVERLEEQLKKKFPNRDMPNDYLRSAGFTSKYFIDNAKCAYLTDDIDLYKDIITQPLFAKLKELRAKNFAP